MLFQSSGTFLLKICSSGANLATRILFARILGVSSFGRFMEVTAWVQTLHSFADLGYSPLLTRSLAGYEARGQWGLYRGLLRRSDQMVLAASFFCMAILLLAGVYFSPSLQHGPLAFWIAGALFPLRAFAGLRGATLLGLRRILTPQLVSFLRAGPAHLLIILAVHHLGVELQAADAVAIVNFTAILRLVIFVIILRGILPGELTTAPMEVRTLDWLRQALPMVLLGSLFIVNTKMGVMIVGSWLGSAEAGIYSVACEWAGIVSYPIMALNYTLLPHVARLHSLGKVHQVQSLISYHLRLATFLAAIILVGLFLAGPWLLALYGTSFATGFTTLLILGTGQLVFTSIGTMWYLMVATRQEGNLIWLPPLGIGLNFILTITLLPRFGLEGVALASAAGVVVSSAIGCLRLHRRTGINSSILPL